MHNKKRFLMSFLSVTFGGSDFSDRPTLLPPSGSIEVKDDFA